MNKYHKIQTVYMRNPDDNYKTLMEGIFSLPEFYYLANNEWVFTEKIDGTNIRVMFDASKITFGAKTDAGEIPPFLLKKLEEMFFPKLDEFENAFENGVCLYGEGYGARIQKGGGNYRQDQSFVLFDVKVGDWWLKRPDVESLAGLLGIEVAPVIRIGNLYEMVEMAREGFQSQWGDFIAEGIVARPSVELKSRNGERIITKIKHKDFWTK